MWYLPFLDGKQPHCGFYSHQMVGLKYSLIRRVRWTIAKAFCKSLSPMDFAMLNSVQGGLAVIISKYPLGYADAKSHCRMSVVMVACDSGSQSSEITLNPCLSRVRRTLPEPENKSIACRDFFFSSELLDRAFTCE